MCNVHVMAMRWMRTIHVMARKRKQADGLSTYVRKACQNFWCSGTPNTLLQPIMRPKSSPARIFLAGASTGLSASQFQHGAKMRSQFQHGPSAFLGPNIYISDHHIHIFYIIFPCHIIYTKSPIHVANNPKFAIIVANGRTSAGQIRNTTSVESMAQEEKY